MGGKPDVSSVLLTGARGIVGGHLFHHLAQSANEFHVTRFYGDIRSKHDVRRCIADIGRIDVVINLAAKVEVKSTKERPDIAYFVNAGGVLNLLSELESSGQFPYFFQCSTSHVYAPSEGAIRETDRTGPVSVYGRTKLMAEAVTQDVCKANGLPFCIGRLFSIHDPNQTGSYLRPSIERRFRDEDLNEPFELHGANSVRDFLTAEDAARLIAELVYKRAEGIINIASGKGTKVRDFVQSLCSQKLNIVHLGATDSLVADTRLLKSIVGTNP
ncbi:GDP-6-deoxy-D-mannose reductase [Roseibium album]|uniref:GDP-6-deoxy-D-mannose reductase n=2 Tax=Roseibium album TaxID=311410 RepID=A0A0M7A694_9HYPH|nr:GDP-6-deoxy-D-mannose reductase [Roseibium album]CTQ69253.1 GDP-6-deoxy-D-mannose reductase [Roseibium album]CTQ80604.1 GDP-6-deoxy-D-mannose reductase [Roseibium album]